MKKLILFSLSLIAICISIAMPDASPLAITVATSVMLSPLGNKEVLERMAIQNFDNYDGEFDNWQAVTSSDEQGIFTIKIRNLEAADRQFFLFNGELLLGQNFGLQIIPALALDGAPGVATATTPSLILNAPIGQIVDGNTRAIDKTILDTPQIIGSGSPFPIKRWLSYALSSRKTQVITGIKIDSATSSNHTGNITVGRQSPYGDKGSKSINLSAFRSPKDYQANVTVVPVGVALKADTYVRMDIAASSEMTLTLFMNGQAMV
ncbi:MAG: hypothetical protein RIS29_2435 [Bacteroidota bacterium]|jgi:hypothetical protein